MGDVQRLSWADIEQVVARATDIPSAGTPPTALISHPANLGLVDISLPKIDLSPVKAAFAAALAALLVRFGPIRQSWTDQLTAQVQRAAAEDDVPAFARLGVDSAQAQAVIADAMVSYADAAAARAADEAAQQGAAATAPPVQQPPLVDQAAVTAELLALAMALSAGNEARRVHRKERPAADTAADVRTHLDDLSDATPKAQLGYSLHVAEMSGRLATMLYSSGVKLYASEQMDDHICTACRAVEGTYLGESGGDVSGLRELYPNGGFVGCLGGINCRGAVVGVWPKEGE